MTSHPRPMHARSLSIRELFSPTEGPLRVPIYQRNYSWTPTEVHQLLVDVVDGMDREPSEQGSYFLGNLVVTRRDGDWELVDGQQRVTTIFLLLAALGQRHETVPVFRGRLRYDARPRAERTLGRLVGGPPDPADADEHDPAMLDAVQAMKVELSTWNPIDITRFTERLLDRVHVVRAELPDVDLNRYFEVMNTRSVQLEPSDIVKARLMSRLGGDPVALHAFHRIWTACSDMDGYVQQTLTREDPTLRSEIFGEAWDRLELDDFAGLSERLTGSARVVDDPAPGAASMCLDDAILSATRTGADTPAADRPDRFRSIIDFPSFLLHALATFTTDGSVEEPRLLEAVLDDNRLIELFEGTATLGSRTQVEQFAVHLLRLRLLFDAYVVKRHASSAHVDDDDWSLQRVVKRERGRGRRTEYFMDYVGTFGTEDRGVLLLESMFRITYTSPRTMRWLTEVLAYLLHPGPGGIREHGLEGVLRQAARRAVRDAIPDWEDPPSGFAIPRIVFTYLDLLVLDHRRPRDRDFSFMFRTSIEHFSPRHPRAEQGIDQVSEENRESLGNLALVSVGTNSAFGNLSPRAKADTYQDTIVQQSPKLQVMAGIVRSAGTATAVWGDDAIVAHHREMMDLLRQDVDPTAGYLARG